MRLRYSDIAVSGSNVVVDVDMYDNGEQKLLYRCKGITGCGSCNKYRSNRFAASCTV